METHKKACRQPEGDIRATVCVSLAHFELSAGLASSGRRPRSRRHVCAPSSRAHGGAHMARPGAHVFRARPTLFIATSSHCPASLEHYVRPREIGAHEVGHGAVGAARGAVVKVLANVH